MTVSEVGRIAIGSAISEDPALVTQATLIHTIKRQCLGITSGAKSAIWVFSLSKAA